MVQTLWMKIVKALTLFLIIGLILHGSTLFSFQEADAETQLTAAEVLEQLQAKAETLQSLQGDFEQRKFSRLLITPLESGGRLFWQPPGRLRWEVVHPAHLTLVAHGENILLLYPDLKKARLYRQPFGGGLLERITGATDDPEALQRQYSIQVALVAQGGSGRWIQMTMEPKSARRARYFKRLEIKINPNTWLPEEISIQQSNKDWTVIYLSNLQENTKLPDGLFSVQPPKDFHLPKYQGGGRP
ncbi:MAG: outer membrane lipoprotein carrier protein LolA [Syntrophobacterales bacterium]|jgi:outer membrane lipoprotein carrier protein